ncbi:MAG: 30S ribosomal protein S9 [Deltaproteobacteria bacterium]|nr:30S ribosomal protein S9 [Deltaproteobacteria bacterium]
MEKVKAYYATGKRKTAIARTWLKPGTGNITINKQPMDKYFSVDTAKKIVTQPLLITDNPNTFDIQITVKGGGMTGQAGAIRHGISLSLIQIEPDLRIILKKAGCLIRDPRVKERKKYGQKGARARYQFSKR